MHKFIQISLLNDFIFDPNSIYYHQVYQSFHTDIYHSEYQRNGLISHSTINFKNYSTSKNIWQGTGICSEKYKLVGKLDLFFVKEKRLVERKRQIKKLFLGYILQLTAQYVCLSEINLTPKETFLYSLIDNKSYKINITKKEIKTLEKIIYEIHKYKPNPKNKINKNKKENCIYSNLYCD